MRERFAAEAAAKAFGAAPARRRIPASAGRMRAHRERSSHRALGFGGRAHQALRLPARRGHPSQAPAQLRGRRYRALARDEQAPRRPSGPHDPELRRPELQGVPGGSARGPAASAPGRSPARPPASARHLSPKRLSASARKPSKSAARARSGGARKRGCRRRWRFARHGALAEPLRARA